MITLTLPYPISANAYWSSRVVKSKQTGKNIVLTFVTHEARAYRQEVGWRARAAGVTAPLLGRVAVLVLLYPHRPLDYLARMRKFGATWDDTVQCIDVGNAEKVLSDALKHVVFGDDKWVWDLHLKRMEPDAEPARVVVKIEQIAPSHPVQGELLEPQAGDRWLDQMRPAEVPF